MYLRKILTIAAMVVNIVMIAQTEATDTVKVIKDAKQLIIQKDNSGNSTITVKGTQENNDYFYELQVTKEKQDTTLRDFSIPTNFPFAKKSRRTISFDVLKNIYVGVSIPTAGDDAISTSYECGIAQVAGITYCPTGQGFSTSIGIGFGTRQFSVKENYYLQSGLDRVLNVIPKEENQGKCTSRISSFYLQVPILFSQRIYKSFGVSFGAIVNLNTYTTANTKYKLNTGSDNEVYNKEKFKGLHQRPLTVDLMATIGFVDSVGAFVRYSPMEMFENGYGPKVKSITAGITFNF